MSVIYEEALLKEISGGNFACVYLLFGEDAYLKKHYLNLISSKTYGGDAFFNLQNFEGDVDLQAVYDAVKQYPMMADSKCVTLSDFDFEHASKEDFEKLCTIIEEVEQGCVLILRFDSIEFDIKKSAKAKKITASVEKVGGRCVSLDHRSTASLVKMLTSGAKKRGCMLSDSTARYLIQSVGDDINILRNELDKLCGFLKKGEIDKKAVDLVCIKSVESSVYDYIKFVLAGDVSGALRLLDDMFYMRIEPMTILYNASSAYVDMYRMLAANRAGVKESDIAKEFNYKNRAFLLEKASFNLRKVDFKKIVYSFDALLVADKALKSFGFDPRTVLEELTVKLVYIIVRGKAVDKT